MGDARSGTRVSMLPSGRNRVIVALGSLFCAAGLVALVALVSRHGNIALGFDKRLVDEAAEYTRAHGGLKQALLAWQVVFYPAVLYVLAVPITVFVWKRGHQFRAAWGTLTMCCGWLLGVAVKSFVHRPRPVLADPVTRASGFSFPSGHVLNAALMLTVCTVMVWPWCVRKAARVTLVVGGIALVVLTGLDRVFLGVHYPSDVLAGALLGLVVVGASYVSLTAPNR